MLLRLVVVLMLISRCTRCSCCRRGSCIGRGRGGLLARTRDDVLGQRGAGRVVGAAHLAEAHVDGGLALDLGKEMDALGLGGQAAVEAKDVVEAGPDAVGVAGARAVVNLSGEQQGDLVLEVGAEVPGPGPEEGVGLELDRVLDDDDARADEQRAQLGRHGVRRVGVVGVQHHGVQAVRQQRHDALGVPLPRLPHVEQVVILLRHAAPEVLDLGQHVRQRDLAQLEPPPVQPNDAHHLIDLETDEGQRICSPVIRRLRRYDGVRELVFVAVHRQLGVVVFAPYDRLRPLGLAGPDVEKAQLVPDQTTHVGLEGCQPVGLPIAVQAHTLGHPHGCPYKD